MTFVENFRQIINKVFPYADPKKNLVVSKMNKSVIAIAAGVWLALTGASDARDAAFEKGWTLNGPASSLHFVSVKKGAKMEVSSFAELSGTIDETGKAQFEVHLDSVDTNVDLRNVRLRFLLFETFNFPKAIVSAQLTEDMLGTLAQTEQAVVTLPFTLDLHGITKQYETDVALRLYDKNEVLVTSLTPIVVELADFDLIEGRDKLQDTAEVTIAPATSITFNLSFSRNGAAAPQLVAKPVPESVQTVALEPQGAFSPEACKGRFEILSRTGRIEFQPSAATLRTGSRSVLRQVASIMEKCPGMIIEVGGHTDSLGPKTYNMQLSEARAKAVVEALVGLGLPRDRLVGRGYGEAKPVASNGTKRGRLRNRRIEFTVLQQGGASG